MNKVLLALVAISLMLTACGGTGLQLHQQVKLTNDLRVVQDWNALSYVKPTCDFHKGEIVEVLDFSSVRSVGPVIQLSNNNCTGWANDDSSLVKYTIDY